MKNQQNNEEKDYIVSVSWEVTSLLRVKAKSAEDAEKFIKDNSDMIPLPTESTYIDGYFKVDKEMTDIYTDMYHNNELNRVDIEYIKRRSKMAERTLNNVLSNELSADKVKDMTTKELTDFLINNKIVLTESDINMLIVEAIQRAVADDDEFPIHYYDKTEPMSEEGKIVEDPGEMLTDSLVHKMKGTYGD